MHRISAQSWGVQPRLTVPPIRLGNGGPKEARAQDIIASGKPKLVRIEKEIEFYHDQIFLYPTTQSTSVMKPRLNIWNERRR